MAPRTTTPAPAVAPSTRVTRSQATHPSAPVLRTSLRASRSSRDLSLSTSQSSQGAAPRPPLAAVTRNSIDSQSRKEREKEKDKEGGGGGFLKRVASKASVRNLGVRREGSVVLRGGRGVEKRGEEVSTYLRIRPPTSPANSSSSTFNHLSLSSTSTVTLTSPSGTAEQYTFTSLLPPTASQSSVFASTALPLLERRTRSWEGKAVHRKRVS
ncbi:hypothetical protein BT69DRAFT_26671 [Atractiella rhizophila]|nr:hypothetical protein BT69DRAFT_26671 [Atractiella rhizophila]